MGGIDKNLLLQAWELSQANWRQVAIVEGVGVTPSAVSLWLKSARHGGVAALYTLKASVAKS
jgi:predicted transcriptional regulator